MPPSLASGSPRAKAAWPDHRLRPGRPLSHAVWATSFLPPQVCPGYRLACQPPTSPSWTQEAGAGREGAPGPAGLWTPAGKCTETGRKPHCWSLGPPLSHLGVGVLRWPLGSGGRRAPPRGCLLHPSLSFPVCKASEGQMHVVSGTAQQVTSAASPPGLCPDPLLG